ncbi:DUF262 domain-containing protein [Marinilabilia salmonicolor]|uniref:GmrSD restriction endonucleases N-terminal domain-containing protein n=1 Tax=Marinilabilia salmonicolor TaxID=989 RepID=A0A368UVI6_9BACT|nr:DUF262 domain-containing protein [Marinilabilia salmonicolor]RCW31374.1 hypothetical protein DFO77_11891 [Marinilabilia salmonicolor]
MELSQGNKELLELAKGAFKGEVMLPDFQRNFVWSRQDIEELFKSLLEDMFIGNFLIHNVDPLNPPFKPIEIEGATSVNSHFCPKPSILVLDGQQRLTSLFYALYSPNIPLRNVSNPYAFFINIQALIQDDIDNSVQSTSKVWREYKSLLNEDESFNMKVLVEKELIPITFLAEDFTEIWFEHYKPKYSSENDKKIRSYIKNIISYKTLTLDVPINEKPENIAVLFERINRTGIKLSIFDLLVARLYKYINLREKWEESFDAYHSLQEYSRNNKRDTTTPYYFIQSLALHHGMSIKARHMLKIDDNILNPTSWNTLIETADKNVLVRLLDVNEYGIGRIDKWFPYSPMIVPFLAFFLTDSFNVDKINRWYWSSVFTERYASSVESKITKDYKEVIIWFKDDLKIPDIVIEMREKQLGNLNFKEKDNSGNSVYKGVFNLLFINDAKDFYEDDKIKYKKTELDDHHIFPKKYLEEKGVTEHINSILNRTLIHGTTNKNISKKAPADYIKIMLNKLKSEEAVKNLLIKHFINDEMFEIMKGVDDKSSNEFVAENYNRFLELREKNIKDSISKII